MSELKTQKDVLDCPKCNRAMRQLKVKDALVDRCENCFGIWLDQSERLKLLQDKSLVNAVDVGSDEQGREKNVITEIDCPRGHGPLHHVSDRAQKHIAFEFCRECQGSFFDAGELRDLSSFTLSERIKSLFGK